MNETELKIYEVAKMQFYNNGYYSTTVRDIAKEAGVNSGLFNYYYKNKYTIAKKMYDDIFYNIKALVRNHFDTEEHPAIIMGIMMRLHTYVLYSDSIVPFVVDALKEGIFEESILTTTAPMVKDIADYYHRDYSEQTLHLLLSITLATEKTCLTQKYHNLIDFPLEQIADVILKIHLQGFDLDKEVIQSLTIIIMEKFNELINEYPNFVELII